MVQIVFAAVEVRSLEFGTLRVMAPPIIRATTCTASPTLFISVVIVVLNPRSLMMTVLNEFSTPLGMAAANTEMKRIIILGSRKVRMDCGFLKAFFLDSRLILRDTLHGNDALMLI